MQDKYSQTHAEISRNIRLAKKRMFKAHRDGVTLPQAADSFIAEVSKTIATHSVREAVQSIAQQKRDDEAEHRDWHDKRYGDQRVKLTSEQIHAMARDIVNGDHDFACKMLLLMDEIERAAGSDHGSIDVACITITVRDAVMPYTVDYSRTHDAIIEALRANAVAAEEGSTI